VVLPAVLGIAEMWAAASGAEQLAVVCLGVALWWLVDCVVKQHKRWAHPEAPKGTDTPAGFIVRGFLTALMDLARAIVALFDTNSLLAAAAAAEAEHRASQAAAASVRHRQGAAAQATQHIRLIERAPALRAVQQPAKAVVSAAAACDNDDEVQPATDEEEQDADADDGITGTGAGLFQPGVPLAVRSLRLHARGLNLASLRLPPFMPVSRRVAAVAAAAASSGAGNSSNSSSMQTEQLRLHLETAGRRALSTPTPFDAGFRTGLLWRRSNARAAAAAADSSWIDDLSRAAANVKADCTWLDALNSVAASRPGVSAQQQLDDAEEAVAEDWPQGQQEREEQEPVEQEPVEQEHEEQEPVEQEPLAQGRVEQEREPALAPVEPVAVPAPKVPCTRDPQVQLRGSSRLSLALREKLAADAVPAPAVVAPAPAAARDDGVRHLLPSWLLERVG
jgi:hypothetical protein